jgi:hypothetical protein
LVGDELVDDICIPLDFEAVIISADSGRAGERDCDNNSRGKIAREWLDHGLSSLSMRALVLIQRTAHNRPSKATRDTPNLTTHQIAFYSAKSLFIPLRNRRYVGPEAKTDV